MNQSAINLHGSTHQSTSAQKLGASLFLLLVLAQASFAQGTFQNLDFELAVISSPPVGYVPTDALNPISSSSALPYWTVREDTTVCTAVWGSPGMDITFVSLDQQSANFLHSALEGNYGVGLSANNVNPGGYSSSSISQTGLIPSGMQSIQFLLLNYNAPGNSSVGDSFIVTLNGTRIPISAISISGYVVTMAGDVSAFAGTTAELRFTADSFFSDYGLDSIVFSSQAVPEPSTISLAGLGLLALGCHQRRKVQRCRF